MDNKPKPKVVHFPTEILEMVATSALKSGNVSRRGNPVLNPEILRLIKVGLDYESVE